MDLLCTTRSSNNFKQYITDDGSLDYSADWETFSFEVELNTRKNIYDQDLKAYNILREHPLDDNSEDIGEIIRDELQLKKELFDELLLTDENNVSKYSTLIEEHRKIKENLEKLIAKNNTIQKDIKNLLEEECTSRKSYKQRKFALQKASEMYTTYFDISILTKSLSNTTYEASIHFKEKEEISPIKFIVDRVERKVIDFHPNDILFPKEKEDITEDFNSLKNLPHLFCTLRESVLKR